MRIGIIGLGDIATKAYLPVVANQARVTPLLCTRNGDKLAQLAAQYRVAEYFTQPEALFAAKPDAVMIHSATEAHSQLVRAALERGIPVFVDKPLSYDLDECESLLALAARRQLPLTLGFNRRFAPLIAPLGNSQQLVQVRMQKNRTRWPAPARVFIYDDFIHVLDSLRFIAPGPVTDLQVMALGKADSLQAVQVNWRVGQAWVTGSMNRVSGLTEERLEVFCQDQKWQIDNLAEGQHWANPGAKTSQKLGFGDWDNTLYKRGFVSMFAAFVAQLQAGEPSNYEDILASHRLCEQVVQEAERQLSA